MFVIESIEKLMEAGGGVLWLIALTTFVMWALIIERVLFFRLSFPQLAERVINEWRDRKDHSSWNAHRIREYRISQIGMELNRNVSFIKILVALCPLLGLLGTVTGMIHVFDVMAMTGSGSARSMASGISMATLPTMAGMVAALSGVYLGSLMENWAKTRKQNLSTALELE